LGWLTDIPERMFSGRTKAKELERLPSMPECRDGQTTLALGVSTPTVQAWIERFAQVYAQKPEPEGRAVVVELEEMWHYLKRPTSSGRGRLGIVLRDSSSTGSWAVGTPSPSSVSLNG
jgi:hypothetical protein